MYEYDRGIPCQSEDPFTAFFGLARPTIKCVRLLSPEARYPNSKLSISISKDGLSKDWGTQDMEVGPSVTWLRLSDRYSTCYLIVRSFLSLHLQASQILNAVSTDLYPPTLCKKCGYAPLSEALVPRKSANNKP